jgi:hypothetical protein
VYTKFGSLRDGSAGKYSISILAGGGIGVDTKFGSLKDGSAGKPTGSPSFFSSSASAVNFVILAAISSSEENVLSLELFLT